MTRRSNEPNRNVIVVDVWIEGGAFTREAADLIDCFSHFTNLFQNRMSAAVAVVRSIAIFAAVVVIKNNVLAFVTHNISNALQIFRVFGNHKC